MRFIILIFMVFSTLAPIVSGATIHGTIYDTQLHPAFGVVVEVNSQPTQRHISKFGGYSFDLENGNYTIFAYLNEEGSKKLIAQENVSINSKGDYIVDLFADDALVFNDLDNESSSLHIVIFLVSLLVTIILILSVILITKYGKAKKIEVPIKESTSILNEVVEGIKKIPYNGVDVNIDSADDVIKKRVLKLISDNGGKLTQKEIRKKIDLSEAKISQIVSSLEIDGEINKVKKGRINIILRVSK